MPKPGTEIRSAGRLPDPEATARAGTAVRRADVVLHWRASRFPRNA